MTPFLSWLFALGRCRHCTARIPLSYPGVELAVLVIAASAAAVLDGWLLWASCGFGWVLLTLAWIDQRHFWLPDALTLPLIPAGLLVIWLRVPARLWENGIGAIAGFALLAGIASAYRRLRGREGLGLGDAKLLAGLGAWVGWQGLASVVFIAAASGLFMVLVARIAGRRLEMGDSLPFGPYLCLGGWLVWLFGPLRLVG